MNKVDLVKLVGKMDEAAFSLASTAILSKIDEHKIATKNYIEESMAMIDAIKELP